MHDPPHILIVGCGAIGGLFASALAAVAEVTAYDANAEHVRAINAQGLRVIGKNPRIARLNATSDPAALKGACVRCRHLPHQVESDRATRWRNCARCSPAIRCW